MQWETMSHFNGNTKKKIKKPSVLIPLFCGAMCSFLVCVVLNESPAGVIPPSARAGRSPPASIYLCSGAHAMARSFLRELFDSLIVFSLATHTRTHNNKKTTTLNRLKWGKNRKWHIVYCSGTTTTFRLFCFCLAVPWEIVWSTWNMTLWFCSGFWEAGLLWPGQRMFIPVCPNACSRGDVCWPTLNPLPPKICLFCWFLCGCFVFFTIALRCTNDSLRPSCFRKRLKTYFAARRNVICS